MTTTAWAAMWRSRNKLNGSTRFLLRKQRVVQTFPTRELAREWIELEYGYIRDRRDLRREPHGWMMPVPVRVAIVPLRKAKVTP